MKRTILQWKVLIAKENAQKLFPWEVVRHFFYGESSCSLLLCRTVQVKYEKRKPLLAQWCESGFSPIFESRMPCGAGKCTVQKDKYGLYDYVTVVTASSENTVYLWNTAEIISIWYTLDIVRLNVRTRTVYTVKKTDISTSPQFNLKYDVKWRHRCRSSQ